MRKLLFILIVVVCGLTACGPSPEQLVKQGQSHLDNGNYTEAMSCFQKAAAKGSAEAEYHIGWMYGEGQGVDQDDEVAADWIKKAAEKNYAKAQNDLALMYYLGIGVPKDYEKAAKWANQSALLGMPESCLVLGLLYYDGQGVPQDYEKAAEWLLKVENCAEIIVNAAQSKLFFMYLTGLGVPQNDEKATEILCKQNGCTLAEAQRSLGASYENGNDTYGIEKDVDKAFKWFFKAAENGDAEAQYKLAQLYWNGLGVTEDFPEGLKWLKKSAENGYAEAQAGLGVLYYFGIGVSPSETDAKYWWQKAADQGDKESKEYLEELEKTGKTAQNVEKTTKETKTKKSNQAEFRNTTFTVEGVSFTMIAVEGGTFQMGATSDQGSEAIDEEKPAHSVTLSNYYLGETEVTQALWKAVIGNPSEWKGDKLTADGDNLPISCVSWNDCQEFIRKLNQKTGKNFRLPTEAEWEYAARGGKKSKGYKYAGSNTIDQVAWYWDNGKDKTRAVKTKSPNELGLYDMSGNLCEWCQDWYSSDYYANSPSKNPKGPSSGSCHVLRSGSLGSDAKYCRVSNRGYNTPDDWSRYYGFRLALSW